VQGELGRVHEDCTAVGFHVNVVVKRLQMYTSPWGMCCLYV